MLTMTTFLPFLDSYELFEHWEIQNKPTLSSHNQRLPVILSKVNNRRGEYPTQYRTSTNDSASFKGLPPGVLTYSHLQTKEMWWLHTCRWWLKQSSHLQCNTNYWYLQIKRIPLDLAESFEEALYCVGYSLLLLLTLGITLSHIICLGLFENTRPAMVYPWQAMVYEICSMKFSFDLSDFMVHVH